MKEFQLCINCNKFVTISSLRVCVLLRRIAFHWSFTFSIEEKFVWPAIAFDLSNRSNEVKLFQVVQGTKFPARRLNYRKYIAVAVSGVRDILAGGQQEGCGEARKYGEPTGSSGVLALVSFTGSWPTATKTQEERGRGTWMASWATSHRETARDRHIHAARFTTIKMGAAESTILLSPGKQYRLIELWLRPVRFSMRGSPPRAAPWCRCVIHFRQRCIEESIRFIRQQLRHRNHQPFPRITWT